MSGSVPLGSRDARRAAVVFLLALLFYLLTMQPSLSWGDGIRLQREVISAESFVLSEIVDVPFAPDPYPFARLGVAAWDHPLYVMFGHTLIRLLPTADPLWLVNFVSVLFAAATVALLYALLSRHTRSPLAAGAAALALAVSHTFWWHAATPEVYTLFSFLLLWALWLFDAAYATGRASLLIGAAAVMGLGLANHLLAGLALPVLAGVAWLRRATLRPTLETTLFMGVAFAFGAAPYWIQLLRLLRTFPLAEVLGPALGTTFFSGSLVASPGALAQSVATYAVFLLYQFNPLGVGLGLAGWRYGKRMAPALWGLALPLYGVYLLFGLVYQVSDQFAFFLGSHVFWALGIGLGAAWLWRGRDSAEWSWPVAAVLLSFLLMPLLYARAPALLRASGVDEVAFGVPQIGTGVRDGLAIYLDPNKAGERGAAEFGRNLMTNLPPDAVVIAEWYTDTDEYFILRYFTVEAQQRPDITVVGWPTVDPFAFDPALATDLIAAEIGRKPIYLASLSTQFYAAPDLLARYCVVPEHTLYRVYIAPPTSESACLTSAAAQP